MNTSQEIMDIIAAEAVESLPFPKGSKPGKTIEHILLSVTIVSNDESAHQFDDSCSYQLQKAMMAYHGIEQVNSEVLYKHTKIEKHQYGCECGFCDPALIP